MNDFNRDMADHILFTLLQLSDDKNNNDGRPTEMSGHIKEEIEAFAANPYSDLELYDFLDKISQIPVDIVEVEGGKLCVGHISAFMKAVCEVRKYYTRPVDGEKKPLNKEECRSNLEKK